MTIVAIVIANVVIWVFARPAHQPTLRFTGEIFGAEAILLFVLALVLATVRPRIETAFGGLDQVAVWHRRVAIGGLVLLVVHIIAMKLSTDPVHSQLGSFFGSLAAIGIIGLSLWALAPSLLKRFHTKLVTAMANTTYEKWLSAHRLTGIFVAVAVVHAVMVDPVLRASRVLLIVSVVIGVVGVAAYLYREFLFPRIVPIFEYTVAEVDRPDDRTIEVSLRPSGEAISFRPGQFIFIAFGGVSAWQRHPFSVASAPGDPLLKVAVRSAGDYTSELFSRLKPGAMAKLAGPFGGFDHTLGGSYQVWVAAGIGITPFLSWIRSLDDSFTTKVDFYYAVATVDQALYADEIRQATQHHPSVAVHVWPADTNGVLSPKIVLAGVPTDADPWIYMCGPPAMMRSFSHEFHADGIPSSQIRFEQFDIR